MTWKTIAQSAVFMAGAVAAWYLDHDVAATILVIVAVLVAVAT